MALTGRIPEISKDQARKISGIFTAIPKEGRGIFNQITDVNEVIGLTLAENPEELLALAHGAVDQTTTNKLLAGLNLPANISARTLEVFTKTRGAVRDWDKTKKLELESGNQKLAAMPLPPRKKKSFIKWLFSW
jgi:hypothetical protein